jgi:hypothetical protein
MSNVFTQYWGSIYSLKPGGKVGCGVGPMATGEILWAVALPSYNPKELTTKNFSGMVANLTNKVNQVNDNGERTVRFEVVNTGQIYTTFDVYFAWTSAPTDF